MKKLLFAIFAHPDDEAFGPSGTLLLETQSGTELHLVTLTSGQAGANPDNYADIGAVRLDEWRQAAKLLGAATTRCLGYIDGNLCNKLLPDIQRRIIHLVHTTIARHKEPFEIEFMTMDDNGITGHVDHTVASRAATFAFEMLRAEGLPVTRLRYACVPRELFPAPNIDWIFMPAGRLPEEIDEVVDAREVFETVERIIRCHHTQRHDGETHLALRGQQVAVNHFIVKT